MLIDRFIKDGIENVKCPLIRKWNYNSGKNICPHHPGNSGNHLYEEGRCPGNTSCSTLGQLWGVYGGFKNYILEAPNNGKR